MSRQHMHRIGGAARIALAVVLLSGSVGCATDGPDPYQGFNHGVFSFNEGLDKAVLEPVAKGWDFVLPGFVQTGVGNFFDNLRMFRTMVNDLLQGKPARSGADLGRFALNTTIGIAGLFDPATPLGIPHYKEDFGQTLGVWGVGPGPYLQVPLLGPYTTRDLLAYPVDFALVPTYLLKNFWGLSAIDIINTRARYIDEIAENRETALDYYVFIRNAYLQNRQRQVTDGVEAAEDEEDDFYDLDDDELEEDHEAQEAGASLD